VGRSSGRRGVAALVAGCLGALGLLAGCSTTLTAVTAPAGGRIVAVGAENEYADVIAQIGGSAVSVAAVMSDPNTDPHTFETSPSVAQTVSSAELVVQNGLGYDTFMQAIEDASPSSTRKVVVVQSVLGLPSGTPNPHVWYDPATMPKVAAAIARDLTALDPAHRAMFAANLAAFDRSLAGWQAAVVALRTQASGAPVATTEPVADDLLQAAGLQDETPFAFQADVMNGVDPSPQAVATVESLLAGRRVRAFVYNTQVTDSLTGSLLALARQHGVPVVGADETMPTPGYHYQSWMVAETHALDAALTTGVSAPSR
jgi:zinc/manganese transport system substrate-binding protein